MSLFPVCIFAFNRPKHIEKTLNALSSNFLSKDTDVVVYVDGPRCVEDEKSVSEVRSVLDNFVGFRSFKVKYQSQNLGLASSIIGGVTEVLSDHEAVIVLEDDLITQPNFLNYMNDALRFYANADKISTICGFSHDLPELEFWSDDIYFGYRPSSWGWGTWKKEWFEMVWEHNHYKRIIKNPINWLKLFRGGSDVPQMLINQLTGKINSWAIRWTSSQMMAEKLAVFPRKSLVLNDGIGELATNTKRSLRFTTNLDQSNRVNFNFLAHPKVDKSLMRSFRNKYSILSRLRDKII
ncbi:MAG: glycosyltransferase [Bacteroidia bacterium]